MVPPVRQDVDVADDVGVAITEGFHVSLPVLRLLAAVHQRRRVTPPLNDFSQKLGLLDVLAVDGRWLSPKSLHDQVGDFMDNLFVV